MVEKEKESKGSPSLFLGEERKGAKWRDRKRGKVAAEPEGDGNG